MFLFIVWEHVSHMHASLLVKGPLAYAFCSQMYLRLKTFCGRKYKLWWVTTIHEIAKSGKIQKTQPMKLGSQYLGFAGKQIQA